VLGYLLYQRNHQQNKKLSALGKHLYETGDLEEVHNELSLDETPAFKNCF
jgi:hypothetical protein